MPDVDALIGGNRRITVRSMATKLNISVGSVEILIKRLKYSKVSARWISRLLNPEHKEKRLIAATQLLQRFEKNGANFLESIVTCDETWVHYFTPESKRVSKQWRHSGSPPPKKAKTIISPGKIMATFFLDSKGILYLDFLTDQKTINADYFSMI